MPWSDAVALARELDALIQDERKQSPIGQPSG